MGDSSRASVFLSYASERAELAREIAGALAAEGHDVFFDRESLAPGEALGRRIREEIAARDVFVVLVSSEIFKEQSYVLSELKFAKQELGKLAGRVLPVVILPVDYRKLDPYVRSLAALYPEGNTAAEVAARVTEMLGRGESVVAFAPRPDVAAKQLEVYLALWSLTGMLPKWGREQIPTYGDLERLSQLLRQWYFDRAGGLFLTRASYSRYAELQNALSSLNAEDEAAAVKPDDYEAIRRLCSSLRRQMAEDLGTRR